LREIGRKWAPGHSVSNPPGEATAEGVLRRTAVMAESKEKPESPFAGRWHIESMTAWDEDFINADVRGFIAFDGEGGGEFQFGYVHGWMDCLLTTRDGEPAVEWDWEGNDEMDPARGRGWAVLVGDELHGRISFHEGEDSGFVAKRAEDKPSKGRR
jgi:hypothetical protein